VSELLKEYSETKYRYCLKYSKRINPTIGLENLQRFKIPFKMRPDDPSYERALKKVTTKLSTTQPMASFEDVY